MNLELTDELRRAGLAREVIRLVQEARKNAGFEVTFGGQVIDRRQLGIDFQLSTSLQANKVVSLGGTQRQVGTTNST